MNCSTKKCKRRSKHSETRLDVEKSSQSHVSKKKSRNSLKISVKTEITLQQMGENNAVSLNISPAVGAEEKTTAMEEYSNPVNTEHQVYVKQEVMSVTEECSTSLNTNPVDTKKDVTHKKTSKRIHTTKTRSLKIPLKVSRDVSHVIHGSNRVLVTQGRSSDFLLHNYGIRLRKGKWIPEEDRILRKNYKKAIKDIPKDDQKYILHITNDTPLKLRKRIKELIKQTNFYSKLGHRLNRMPVSCLKRAKHIFKDYKFTGTFSAAEKEQLDKLVLKYGHKWNQISKITGRSAYSISSYFHKYKPKEGRGPFTPLEHQQLCEAVSSIKKEHGIPSDQYQNIPWSKIALQVPTRTVTQCKIHWLQRTRQFDQNCSAGVFYNMANKKLLVELLYDLEVSHEFDVNWSDIAKEISSKLTPQYLQHYWLNMKKTFVPNYRLMSFDEIREYLYNKFHPFCSV